MTLPLTLEDLFKIASVVSGKSTDQIRRAALSVDLIDSALHAPFAGFGDTDVYERFEIKVGVLGYRLLKAHGLPDWNKRSSVAAMGTFAWINGYELVLEEDTVFKAVIDAAANTIDEPTFVKFIANHVHLSSESRA